MISDRRRYRDASEAGFGAGRDWAPMAFNFTQVELADLAKRRPDLFDRQMHPRDRAKLWKQFADTSEGRAFRVR